MATIPIHHRDRKERLLSEIIPERRATPSFDGSPVAAEDLRAILQAGVEAPSGYNIQPWRFVVVRAAEQKKRLRQAAMGQPKVEEAGAVVVACGDWSATRGESLDKVLENASRHGFSEQQNEAMKKTVTGVFSAPPGNAMGMAPDPAVWLNRHVMIAFTTMMWMAEALGYDTAPMEGFFEDKVREVLGIPEKIRVVALLAIGKRKGADKLYAGRHDLATVAFSEKWGENLKF
jgi:nitroreductase